MTRMKIPLIWIFIRVIRMNSWICVAFIFFVHICKKLNHIGFFRLSGEILC